MKVCSGIILCMRPANTRVMPCLIGCVHAHNGPCRLTVQIKLILFSHLSSLVCIITSWCFCMVFFFFFFLGGGGGVFFSITSIDDNYIERLLSLWNTKKKVSHQWNHYFDLEPNPPKMTCRVLAYLSILYFLSMHCNKFLIDNNSEVF